jgi:hypothetical protein
MTMATNQTSRPFLGEFFNSQLVLLSQKVAACSGILGLALRILCERAYPGCMRGDDGPFAQ